MVFAIFDQGIRIKTPIDDVFPNRQVNKPSSIAATPNINQHNIDKTSQHIPTTRPLKTYQKINRDTEQSKHLIYQAEDIMSSPVESLKTSATIADAWELFQNCNFRHIPIIDQTNKLQGILSDRDILIASSKLLHQNSNDLIHRPITNIMNKKVLTAEANTEVRLLADAITTFHIGAIPILNEQQFIVGIVTRSDIVRTLINRAPLELWT